jgi:glycosyl transferase family 87
MQTASTKQDSRLARLGAFLCESLLAFLTPRRVWSYPLVSLVVLVVVAAYDRASGTGLINGISGPFGGDFLSFYTGGTFVRTGHADKLIDAEAQHAFQQQLLGVPTGSVSVWVSPPYFAYLFAPLSLLPYRAAFALFIVLSAVALFATLGVFTRELYPKSTAIRLCFVALQYYPTLEWLLNGQMTGLWLTLHLWVFLLLRRERDGAAGLALGLLVCKPQLALGIAAALLGARRFRALFAALLSGGACVALGFATVPDAMLAYAQHGQSLVSLVRDRGYNTAGLHGSFEFATLLFDGASPTLALVAGVCLTLLLLFVIGAAWARAEWRAGTRAFDLRMAATFALAVIASPHLYNYDLMLLMLPLFVSAARLSGARGLPLDGGPILCATALVWALGLLGPALTVAQQALSTRLLGFSSALQLGFLAVALWAHLAWRASLAVQKT